MRDSVVPAFQLSGRLTIPGRTVFRFLMSVINNAETCEKFHNVSCQGLDRSGKDTSRGDGSQGDLRRLLEFGSVQVWPEPIDGGDVALVAGKKTVDGLACFGKNTRSCRSRWQGIQTFTQTRARSAYKWRQNRLAITYALRCQLFFRSGPIG